jgi:hypothetical protein
LRGIHEEREKRGKSGWDVCETCEHRIKSDGNPAGRRGP